MKGMSLFVFGLSLHGTACASESYDGLPDKFIDLFASGNTSEAISLVLPRAPGEERDAKIEAVRITMDGDLRKAGAYRFRELVQEEKLGDHWARQSYIVGFETKPMLFIFQLYKADKNWSIKDVHTTSSKEDFVGMAERIDASR